MYAVISKSFFFSPYQHIERSPYKAFFFFFQFIVCFYFAKNHILHLSYTWYWCLNSDSVKYFLFSFLNMCSNMCSNNSINRFWMMFRRYFRKIAREGKKEWEWEWKTLKAYGHWQVSLEQTTSLSSLFLIERLAYSCTVWTTIKKIALRKVLFPFPLFFINIFMNINDVNNRLRKVFAQIYLIFLWCLVDYVI